MKKILFIFSICIFAKFSYAQISADGYQNGDDGMRYKIIKEGNNNMLIKGQFLELQFMIVLSKTGKQDSVLNNTRELGAPQFMAFDTLQIPPAYYKVFSQMSVGDSVTTRNLVDSIFKQNPE